LRVVRSNWPNAVLVCEKCSRKLDGGFGPKGKTPLAKALRKYLGLKRNHKANGGVLDVRCLKICPKGAVTVVSGMTPHEWLLVEPGTDLGELAAILQIAPA
jgi:predicted metal-binding protein